MKKDDVYKRLQQHYNSGDLVPQRREIIEIFKLKFTPEEAELALHIPMQVRGRTSVAKLAQEIGRQEGDVRDIIDRMIHNGVIYIHSDEDGQEVLALWEIGRPLTTGTFYDGKDSDERRKLSALTQKLWQAGYPYLYRSKYSLYRVMPAEKYLDSSAEVASYERISHIVGKAKSIALTFCGCRLTIRKCLHSTYTCLHFDEEAEYYAKYRAAQSISHDECLQVIDDALKDGLVITAENNQDRTLAICACCPCCCFMLRPYAENYITHAVARSNFAPAFDREKCKPCMICREACPVKAIGRYPSRWEGQPDKMVVVEDRCIGCGVCCTACPREAISLKKVRVSVPAANSVEAMIRTIHNRAW